MFAISRHVPGAYSKVGGLPANYPSLFLEVKHLKQFQRQPRSPFLQHDILVQSESSTYVLISMNLDIGFGVNQCSVCDLIGITGKGSPAVHMKLLHTLDCLLLVDASAHLDFSSSHATTSFRSGLRTITIPWLPSSLTRPVAYCNPLFV